MYRSSRPSDKCAPAGALTVACYSTVEEFINHALEKEVSQLEGADSEEEIKKRLKGLGYIS